jgi:hypothetical protein
MSFVMIRWSQAIVFLHIVSVCFHLRESILEGLSGSRADWLLWRKFCTIAVSGPSEKSQAGS